MLALRGNAEDAGTAFAFHTPMLGGRVREGRIEIDAGGETPMSLECKLLVNAAGLGATSVARSVDGMPVEQFHKPILRRATISVARRARRFRI